MLLAEELNKIPNWSLKWDINRWCDYIELRCLGGKDKIITKDEVIDWFLQDKEDKGQENYASSLDKLTAEVDDLFNQIRYRSNNIDVFYPFNYEIDCLTKKDNIDKNMTQYIFLLVASSTVFIDRSSMILIAKEFEEYCVAVFKYLVSEDSEVHIFGTSRKQSIFRGNLRTRIEKLASCLGAQTTKAFDNDKQFDADRAVVLESLKDAGVTQVVNVSASWKDLMDTLELISKVPFMYGAVGIHPDHVGELNEERMEQLREYCHRDKIVAVGEIGLDYHWNVEPKEVQQEWLIRQLHLATEEKLPVIIHSRDASQDTFDIMKKEHAGTTGGVIHCFSGSAEMAKEYVKMGYYIGVGGVVTFKNSRVLKEVVKAIPLECIVVETDCPYLAPAPHRGKRNSSAYLPLVIEEIARLKEITAEEVENVTYENAQRLYGLIH